MQNQPELVQFLIGLFDKADPNFYRTFQEKSHLLSRDELQQIMLAIDENMRQLLASLRGKEATAVAA